MNLEVWISNKNGMFFRRGEWLYNESGVQTFWGNFDNPKKRLERLGCVMIGVLS